MAEEGVSQPLAREDAVSAVSSDPVTVPPVFEPLNLTTEAMTGTPVFEPLESSDYALDLKAFLQQHPAAF